MPQPALPTRSRTRAFVLTCASLLAACGDAAPRAESASLALAANATTPSSLEGPGGVRLDVPAGASTTDMTIVLATEPGSRRASRLGALVATPLTLSPEGATFEKTLEITIPITPSSLPGTASLDDVVVLSAPHGSTVYAPLPTRRAGNAVIATTTHFSDFVAVLPPAPIDAPDEACPIATTSWSSTASMTIVRSILVREGSVYAVADSGGTVVPLYALPLDTGAFSGTPSQIERPASPVSTHFPRLVSATLGGREELFVSYLRTLYDDGSIVTEYGGGLVRVGPTSAPPPVAASLIVGVDGSVDGIYADVTGPRVLAWPTLASITASLATVSDSGGATTLDSGVPFGGLATPFERAEAIHAAERLVGFVRAEDDDPGLVAEHWTGWVVDASGVGQPLVLPGTITSFAAHDTLPVVYAVDSTGAVREYSVDATFALVVRVVTQLPAEYSAAGSSAKMAYSNGSIVFPAFRNGVPRIVRVRVESGHVDEWTESDASVIGWSALTADDGVVCYASSSNTLRCGCFDGAFTPLP